LSETINIRGRLSAVRISPSVSRHALPGLEPGAISGPQHFPAGPAHDSPPSPEVEALLRVACERGRAEGKREAEREAAPMRDALLAEERRRVDAFIASLDEQMSALSARLEREAFRFAIAVAGRIIKREVTVDDQVALRQIHDALRRVAGMESVRLRLNPRDEALVRQDRDALVASSESVREIIIEVDEKVEPGGCLLETASGTVDARLYTQLEQIEAALFGQVSL
jgi:flagellar assembly protein FliH